MENNKESIELFEKFLLEQGEGEGAAVHMAHRLREFLEQTDV